MSQIMPIKKLPFLAMQGLQVSYASNTTLTVGAGLCRDSSNTMDIVIGNSPLNNFTVTAPITVNAAVNGYNGLDTGSLANNTWYALYMIGDSSYKNPPGAILTLASNAAPKLPIGKYDSYRLRYYVLTNASAQFLQFYMIADNANIINVWDSSINVLTSGSSTSFATISLGAAVPPVSSALVRFDASYYGNFGSNQFYLRPTGSAATTGAVTASCVAAQRTQILQVDCLALFNGGASAVEIDYQVQSGDQLSLAVNSFEYSV